MTSDQRVEYSRAVWAAFEARRGRPGEMSSAEFDLIHKWIKRGVLLHVALRGIAEVKDPPPRTLHACQRSVERVQSYQAHALLPSAEPEIGWDAQAAEAERARIFAKFGRDKEAKG